MISAKNYNIILHHNFYMLYFLGEEIMIVYVAGKSGSGKSTLAKGLAESLGYKYVDVDSIGHSVYDIPFVMEQVERLFGKSVYDEDGTFNRKKLGQIVFQESSSERVKMFNELTWEYMQKDLDKLLEENQNLVIDWVLLPQTKYWQNLAYKVLVNSCDDDKRFEKLLTRDKVSLEYLKLRDKAGIEYNEAEFNYVIENDYFAKTIENHIENIKRDIKSLITLDVLGTKSPFAKADSACPSYLLASGENKIMLDCGSGSHRFYNFDKLDGLNIVVSHLHRDHYNDLYNYMYASLCLKNLGRLNHEINIYLPSNPCEIFNDIANEKLTFSKVHGFDKNCTLKIGEADVELRKVIHSSGVDSYAIKVSLQGKTIVYTGDISFGDKENIVDFARDCDVLICDSSFLRSYNFPEICNHLTAFQAGTIAKEANVKKLMLTHFWGEEEVLSYVKEACESFQNTIALKEGNKIYI